MSSLLKGPIAKLVNKGMKAAKLTLSATLIKINAGTRGATVSAGTNPTTTNYSCIGFVADYADINVDGTLITVGDRQVSLLGASLPTGITPSNGDNVTIDNVTYRIERVTRDPAGAVFLCQARGLP